MAMHGGLYDNSPGVVAELLEEERAASRRVILAARKQGLEDAIRWLELVEKHNSVMIATAGLKELRARVAALSDHPQATP